jgi:tetratricopeptide (TPR) repeat protein
VSEQRYRVVSLDEVERVAGWIPIRRRLGIAAFGVNAWRPPDDGGAIIGEHDEATTGHEELYFVVSGHAAFTVDGEQIEAPAGTFVFVRDPASRRGAVSQSDATTILSLGAKPGEAYRSLPWEENAEVIPLFGTGEYERAKELLEQALERHPDAGGLLYNLACAESRLGETEAALEHVRRALELLPSLREVAAGDSDLDAIRDDPRFPS